MSVRERKRVHVIACGVLALDLQRLADQLKIDLSMEFLPGGLHETPEKLREKLQERIDFASNNEVADIIALGYGICGRGTVGIKARNIPLVIPRVHDCIALFLGSDAEYRRQFAKCPGTYYVSAGWIREKVTPQQNYRLEPGVADSETVFVAEKNYSSTHPPVHSYSSQQRTCRVSPEHDVLFSELVERYGEENAEAIEFFFSSWQRNYTRAAYIDTGVESGSGGYPELARKMSHDYGWEYEKIIGTDSLLKKLLLQRSTSEEILYVPPGYVTVWDAPGKGLSAALRYSDAENNDRRQVVFFNDRKNEITGEEYQRLEEEKNRNIRYGMGIDAGGTYTDIVVFDFQQEQVVAKAKAPTTRWNFTIGIRQAIAALEFADFSKIELVTLSTTLATNAIVEGKGQKVGLLIMPPFGLFSPEDIDYSPVCVVDGRLDIKGQQISPVDPQQIVRVASEMIEQHGVKAFAVAGFASISNNAHELEIKNILKDAFGCSVTCGHEISSDLNYRTRSITSVLNARIIPCLEKLLVELTDSLAEQGIKALQMVVRSDGSLMNMAAALQKPVETILSGPAASVKGAGFLANLNDGLVVDIGGTTTDTAIISAGEVQVNSDGAVVGGFRTHIKTLDLRTTGLGGDSNIRHNGSDFVIGPERVMPVCRLAQSDCTLRPALDWLQEHKDRFSADTAGMEIVALTDYAVDLAEKWQEKERKIVEILRQRPYSLAELAVKIDVFSAAYLPLHNLEDEYVVQRCGFTPTDVLHITGRLSYWDTSAAQRLGGIIAEGSGMSVLELSENILMRFHRLLAVDVIKRELAGEVDVAEMADNAVVRLLLENIFSGGNAMYKAGFQLLHPVVGIGAPAGELLRPVSEWFGVECIIPPNGEVANAVGAVISSVRVKKSLRIETDAEGRFVLLGAAGSAVFDRFEAAHAEAVSALYDITLEAARISGAEVRAVKISWLDRIAALGDGGSLFLGRIFTGEVVGMPVS